MCHFHSLRQASLTYLLIPRAGDSTIQFNPACDATSQLEADNPPAAPEPTEQAELHH